MIPFAPERVCSSVFGEWILLREVESPRGGQKLALDLAHTELAARAVRGALLRHADDPAPALLSGHFPDGRPLDRPHAAFLALPAASPAGPGRSIAGVAIVLPRDVQEPDRQAILLAAEHWQRHGLRLLLGRHGVALLEPVPSADPADPAHRADPFDAAGWTAPSQRWASVTPVALDRNPGELFARDPEVAAEAAGQARETLARACERVGLPRPVSIRLSSRPFLAGVPNAARYGPFTGNGKGLKRVCVHTELVFGEPIAGPVLLGAGRYFGVGLLAPVGSTGEACR